MRRVLQLIALSLFTGYTGIAQDFSYKIPETASAVASIKSDQLFQLFSIEEFNHSTLGQRLLDELSKKANGSYKSIADLGFNLSSTIYYYHQKTDSISYHCLLIPLTDARKFETLFNETSHASIKQQGEIRILQTDGNKKNLLMWNNDMLYVAYGSLNTYFFNDSLTASRYGIRDLSYIDNPYDETVYDTAVITDAAEAAAEAATEAVDTVETTVETEAPMSEAVTEEIPGIPPVPEAIEEIKEESAYTRANKEQEIIKDSLVSAWMVTYSLDIFNKNNSSPSILNNPAYLRSLDKNAIGSFWLADLQRIYSGYLPYNFLKYGNMLKGYGSVNARLYMDKEHMRITGEMALDEDKADAYRKIYDKKLNKKFLKYIKSDSLIGFMSYAFDTESYLKELPKIFSQTYGTFSEEIDLGGDLLSLMLDEKAIAKVVKGDALILITNLTPKESTYQTYVYDENYERKDTVQTKTETLPDILCMFSSDDTHLIEKLLKYGISKHKIQFANNIYSLYHSTKNPFNLHILLKDGIVFMGTSLTDIEQINAGTYKGNLNKQQKELLLKNNMTMFFSPKNLHDKMPVLEMENMSETISKLLGNSGNVYLKSSGIKGNYISAELIADVPNNQENALKYFFSLFNDIKAQ
ncbi:hypothetical protein SAMN05518672_103630 [Chitinophaga sp. CF118]|uniref:hypothetical protein n=1 Tax=Chitinophaga sp. CF118 TaxID=1884367 RepID=UPI0008E14F6F|nr:hypothetical protein [Chitinophaga sp. CF118]SFD87420.1 hypothetical protein SAMN05518672_103630 [Chitinophaga sp. CF118]